MDRKQKIIITITSIFIVLLALLGLTYAYFLTQIRGNDKTKSISVSTANLMLVYGNDNGSIIGEGEKIIPNTTFREKTFTVTNVGSKIIENYGVILENVKIFYAEDFVNENNVSIKAGTQTEFVSPEDFELKITCTKKNGTSCNGMTGTLPLMESKNDPNIKFITNGILVNNTIEVGDVHTYSVILKYKDTGNDQSADMNKTLEGRFNIIDVNNTIDFTGTVAKYTPGDEIETNSVRRTSQINSDGSYKIIGLEEGFHKIYLVGKSSQYIADISIIKGDKPEITWSYEVAGPEIIMTDTTRTAQIDIDVNGWIYREKIKLEEYNPYPKGTLAYNILKNAYPYDGKSANATVYVEPSTLTSKFATEVLAYDTRVLSYAIDDLGTSYYFRGNSFDNFINFDGMCWRIVRIEGDGSIKLILEHNKVCDDSDSVGNHPGTGEKITKEHNGGENFNHPDNHMFDWVTMDNGSFGYDLNPSNNNAIVNYLNPTSTDSILRAFHGFQNTYLDDDDKEMLKADTWCIADKMYSDKTKHPSKQNALTATEMQSYFDKTQDNEVWYESYLRLYSNAEKTPTFRCSGTELTTYGEELNNTPMYVGTITADEAVFAGALLGKANQFYYLVNKNYWNHRLSAENFWTLSPRKYEEDKARIYAVRYTGDLNNDYVDSLGNKTTYRPAITLKSDIKLVSGNGTLTAPYEIQ